MLAVAAVSTAGCSSSDWTVLQKPLVLPESAIGEMLAQCSRDTPASGEASWTPASKDIRRLEAQLPDLLVKSEPQVDWSTFPQEWYRQYVGIVRGGRRYLYGNFARQRSYSKFQSEVNVSLRPIMVCDGGPTFFGAEMDAQTGQVTHLAFNGEI